MQKLKTLKEISTEDIQKTIKWMKENQQPSEFIEGYLIFSDLIKDFERELKCRENKCGSGSV